MCLVDKYYSKCSETHHFATYARTHNSLKSNYTRTRLPTIYQPTHQSYIFTIEIPWVWFYTRNRSTRAEEFDRLHMEINHLSLTGERDVHNKRSERQAENAVFYPDKFFSDFYSWRDDDLNHSTRLWAKEHPFNLYLTWTRRRRRRRRREDNARKAGVWNNPLIATTDVRTGRVRQH